MQPAPPPPVRRKHKKAPPAPVNRHRALHRASKSLPSSGFSTVTTAQPTPARSPHSAPTPRHPSPSSSLINKITRLAQKRITNYIYYERIHLGGGGQNRVHWMNMVRIRRSNLYAWYRRRAPTLQKRGQAFYALGMSLGDILSSSPDNITLELERVRQLLLEYEFCYHSKGTASQNISLMMAKERGLFPLGNFSTEETSKPTCTHPTLFKHNNKPLYLMLETSQCPGLDVDYIEMVISLCTVLTQLYNRVLATAEAIANSSTGGGSGSSQLSDVLLSIDTILTKRVVQVISEDMHAIAIDLLRVQQQQIATLFDSELLVPTLFGMDMKKQ